MTTTPQLVALGHIVCETIYFPDRTLGPVLGSPPAYSLVAAARQGISCGIVTKIGDDFPKNLLATFDQVGLDTQGILNCGSFGKRVTAKNRSIIPLIKRFTHKSHTINHQYLTGTEAAAPNGNIVNLSLKFPVSTVHTYPGNTVKLLQTMANRVRGRSFI